MRYYIGQILSRASGERYILVESCDHVYHEDRDCYSSSVEEARDKVIAHYVKFLNNNPSLANEKSKFLESGIEIIYETY